MVLEEHLVNRVPDVIEFALEGVDEAVKAFVHNLFDVQKLEFGPQSAEELFGAIAEVSGRTAGDR